MNVERRNYQRYPVKERAFAGLIGKDSNEIFQLGMIIDIGKGGVCSFYVPTKKSIDAVSHVSIFGQTDSFVKVENIPCEIIYDRKIPWSELQEIRCGIKFMSQSASQENEIEDFIKVITKTMKSVH